MILALAAMGFVCFPLFASNVVSKSEAENEQVLYQARLAEIDKDLELGRLDEASAQAAKSEEARKLIKISETSKEFSRSSRSKLPIVLAAISLPLFSIPYYYSTGAHEIFLTPPIEENNSAEPSIQDLLKVAENRLQSNPDDVKGWKVIAPVYLRMGRFKDAIRAYENILRVEGRNSENLLKLADVYIEQGQGQINQQAKNLIFEVLSVDSENATAKFYTGIIALQDDDAEKTMRIWQGMLDSAKGDEEWLPAVRNRIAELRTLENSPKSPNLTEETVKTLEAMSPSDRMAAIGQMVSNLAEKLKEEPDNKPGWQRLIRSYIILGRGDDAKKAFKDASRQFSDDPGFIASLDNMIQSLDKTTNGGSQ